MEQVEKRVLWESRDRGPGDSPGDGGEEEVAEGQRAAGVMWVQKCRCVEAV